MLRKGNLVVVAQHEAVSDVELRIGAVERQRFRRIEKVCAVIYEHAQGVGYIIQTVRPGVVCVEAEPIPKSPDGFDFQGVVAGGCNALNLGNAVKPRIDQIILRTECTAGLVLECYTKLRLPRILVGKTGSRSGPVSRRHQ